jgi:hypothetical protein
MDGLLRIFVEQYLEVTKLIRIFAHKYRRYAVNGASQDSSQGARHAVILNKTEY